MALRTGILALVLVALSAAPAPLRAQTLPPWTGTVKSSGKTPFQWSERIEGTVEFEFVEYRPGTKGAYYYTLKSADLTWNAEGSVAGCEISGSVPIDFDPSRDFGELFVYDDTTYIVNAHILWDRIVDEVMMGCPAGQLKANGALVKFMDTGSYALPMKEGGTRIQENRPGEGGEAWIQYEFDLTNTTPPPAPELVIVDDTERYPTWLPTAGKDEATPGSGLVVTAELRQPDGSPLLRKANAFRFDLVDVSAEPGVAMNFPERAAARTTPDLRITGSANQILLADPNGQWIILGDLDAGDIQTANVTVSAFDYGAFGGVKVEAVMEGGERIEAHLEADPEKAKLLLPKRADTSFIADEWKRLKQAEAFLDDEDTDWFPQGDKHDGDGLTFYEEYRGFMVGGVHTRTDPWDKDVFVRNAVGAAAAPGVALFGRISGLTVHGRLDSTEVSTANRVINFNRAQGPHVVDQHVLWLKSMGGSSGGAEGGPGTPKLIRYIELADGVGAVQRASGRRNVMADVMAPHVAHELLHGCNVWHHGDRDLLNVDWRIKLERGQPKRDAESHVVILENFSREVQPRMEQGLRVTPLELQIPEDGRLPAAIKVPVIGVPQGQHSGNENCVMRYESAAWYAPNPQQPERYQTHGERLGVSLCTSADGTGVNQPGRNPRVRYGPADSEAPEGPALRGDCAGKICVNDFYAHPRQ